MNEWFEAEHRVERAQQLSESQRWEEALHELDAALSINPNHASWHAHRGFLLEELDRWEEAVEAYEASLEIEPADCDVGIALAGALTRLDRLAKALKVCEDLVQRYPDFEPAYCQRISIYAELGQHDLAEEMFYHAQEIEENCPHCFDAMGSSLLARGLAEKAIFCWKRVLEIEPGYIGVRRMIAQGYRFLRKLEMARDYYLREVREDPGNTGLLFELAELTLESGELASATARFIQILELDPDHLRSHFALGKIWLLRAQPAKALACFEAIKSLAGGDPEIEGLPLKAGEALLQLGRFEEARLELEAAVEGSFHQVMACSHLGDALLALRKPSEAADAYRRVLALEADEPTAHYRLGVCLYQLGNYSAGLAHHQHALRVKPGYGDAMLAITLGLMQLGRWGEARAALRRAVRSHPDNNELRRLARRFWYLRLRQGVRIFPGLGWLKAGS